MSGGEKSAAIHLPLFAAANALYSSAKDHCPRLIALDEAFVGIDERYKPAVGVAFPLGALSGGMAIMRSWIDYAGEVVWEPAPSLIAQLVEAGQPFWLDIENPPEAADSRSAAEWAGTPRRSRPA